MLALAQGRPTEAETLLRRVIEARERVLGPEHADTLGTYGNLGIILQRAGRLAEAEEALTTCWQGLCATLSPTHHTTLIVANHLVGAIDAQDWPEKSQPTVKAMIEAGRQAVQRTDVTANELNDLAWLLMHAKPESLRDFPTALTLARRACEAERSRKGPSLWSYLDTLASAQFQQGQTAEALAIQREALSLLPDTGEQYRGEMEARLRKYEQAVAGE
jgi:tetratricopeptide (TPR) repeat protein